MLGTFIAGVTEPTLKWPLPLWTDGHTSYGCFPGSQPYYGCDLTQGHSFHL